MYANVFNVSCWSSVDSRFPPCGWDLWHLSEPHQSSNLKIIGSEPQSTWLHTKCGYISFLVPLECIQCPGNFPPCSNLISRTSDYHWDNVAKPFFISTDEYLGDILSSIGSSMLAIFFFFCDWYDLFAGNRFCSAARGDWYGLPWVFVSIIDISFVTVSTWNQVLKSNIIVL